jgi:hypothetical protein
MAFLVPIYFLCLAFHYWILGPLFGTKLLVLSPHWDWTKFHKPATYMSQQALRQRARADLQSRRDKTEYILFAADD